MSDILERDTLIAKITAWQEGGLASEQLWHWALQTRESQVSADEVVINVMDMLCALPQDLWIPEDAEVFLDALGNTTQDTDLSVNLLWNYPDIVDTRSRRRDLADDPFYGAYCVD